MRTPSQKLMNVTPERAADWLSHAIYERQRRRADWHVRRLAVEAEAGRLIPGTQIHFAMHEARLHLVNGQHTLAAIVKAGRPVVLSVLQTEVDSLEEAGQLYGRHDRGRSRTPHDAFLGMGLDTKLELSEREVNALGAAIRYLMSGFRRVNVHNSGAVNTQSLDLVAAEMEKWAPEARIYFSAVSASDAAYKPKYLRAGVVAVALVTLRRWPGQRKNYNDIAATFWRGLAADDGLRKGDPRKALNRFLLSRNAAMGDKITFMRHVAAAWNRFVEGGTLTKVVAGDIGKVGITILGTPFQAETEAKAA